MHLNKFLENPEKDWRKILIKQNQNLHLRFIRGVTFLKQFPEIIPPPKNVSSNTVLYFYQTLMTLNEMEIITITADRNKVDVSFVHNFLSNKSYWALARTPEEVKTTIQFSESFSIFKNDQQIGFARVTTDYVALAYLADVFIVEDERGKGYSKRLLDFIFNYEPLSKVTTWRLMSTDARGLYAKYGFTELANPEKMMEWKKGLH